MTLGLPGAPIHISEEPITSSVPNTAIHSAIMNPAPAVAKPHSDCPVAGSGATWVAKYGAKTKVVISVKYGCAAQSKKIQLATALREA